MAGNQLEWNGTGGRGDIAKLATVKHDFKKTCHVVLEMLSAEVSITMGLLFRALKQLGKWPSSKCTKNK
ncbi:hypothetical protein CEXT_370121 [Caerostris extrusa]|uniref:Uncharacterized protein n=1 Tax=Caerostris extrusa TaxID=172846 RepID=A0AAV4NDD2_CAEEX|nr:hypothetical protein CEXT_370121 [Caerostris extrusa]